MKLAWKAVPALAAILLLAVASLGQVPREFNYQGYLTDDAGVPLDGDYAIRFRLYPDSVASTSLWVEYHPSIPVDDGLFHVILGKSIPCRTASSSASTPRISGSASTRRRGRRSLPGPGSPRSRWRSARRWPTRY